MSVKKWIESRRNEDIRVSWCPRKSEDGSVFLVPGILSSGSSVSSTASVKVTEYPTNDHPHPILTALPLNVWRSVQVEYDGTVARAWIS